MCNMHVYNSYFIVKTLYPTISDVLYTVWLNPGSVYNYIKRINTSIKSNKEIIHKMNLNTFNYSCTLIDLIEHIK